VATNNPIMMAGAELPATRGESGWIGRGWGVLQRGRVARADVATNVGLDAFNARRLTIIGFSPASGEERHDGLGRDGRNGGQRRASQWKGPRVIVDGGAQMDVERWNRHP
jgi:hypothetical protein